MFGSARQNDPLPHSYTLSLDDKQPIAKKKHRKRARLRLGPTDLVQTGQLLHRVDGLVATGTGRIHGYGFATEPQQDSGSVSPRSALKGKSAAGQEWWTREVFYPRAAPSMKTGSGFAAWSRNVLGPYLAISATCLFRVLARISPL